MAKFLGHIPLEEVERQYPGMKVAKVDLERLDSEQLGEGVLENIQDDPDDDSRYWEERFLQPASDW